MNRSFLRHSQCLTCALAGAMMVLQAETVEFSYSPTADSVFDITETVTRVTTEPEQDAVTDVRTRKSLLTIVKPSTTGNGHTVTSFSGSAQPLVARQHAASPAYENTLLIGTETLTRNDNPIVSPVYAAMTALTLTYKLDSDGKLMDITGYKQLTDAMSNKLPDKLASTLSKLLSLDSLRRKDEDSYNELHGPYAGASIEVGTDQTSVTSHALPIDGSVPLFAVSSVTQSDDNATIQLSRTFNSDAATLAGEFDSVTEEDLTELQGDLTSDLPEGYASVSVSGTETADVEVSGSLVTKRTIILEYTLTPEASGSETPAATTVTVTREFLATPVSTDDSATDPS